MDTIKTNYLIYAIIFLALNLSIFSYMMCTRYCDDENMYISAGVLIQQHSLYKDFPFLQMPYLPMLYGIIYKLTGTTYYFLTAELINFLFMAISCLMVFLISLKLTKNILFALGIQLLFLFNDITLYTMSYSANTIMPIAFSLLGGYLYIINAQSIAIKRIGILFSGIAIAIAIGTKLYYAVTLPPFIIISFIYPKLLPFKGRITKIMIPFSIGIIIGLLPVFYYFLRNIELFMFNNLDYHHLNTVYREITGHTHAMSSIAKINFGITVFKCPANIALIIGALFLFVIKVSEKQKHNLKDGLLSFLKMENLLFILLVIFTVITAFMPTPLWLHYFALPFPFVIILIASWYSDLTTLNKKFVNILVICLIPVSLLGSGTPLLKYVNQIGNPNKWTSVNIHAVGEQLKSSIGPISKNQKVATLYPLYALEGGLPIYKELSTWTFIYRLGKLIPEAIRNNHSYVTALNVKELFEKDPPKAILIDSFVENQLFYKPFIEYAESNNYQKIVTNFYEMTLYVQQEK